MAFNNIINKVNVGLGFAGAGLNALDSLTGRGRTGGSAKYSLQKFISNINTVNGLHKPSLYIVNISQPKWKGDQAADTFGMAADFGTGPGGISQRSDLGGAATPLIPFIASSVNLPGKNIVTAEDVRFGYGTIDRKVTGATNSDVAITFFVSNDGQPLRYFTEWTENMLHTNVSKGTESISANGVAPMKIRYKENYECEIEIILLSPDHSDVITYKLYEAMPTNVGDVSLQWALTDTFSSVAVSFHYRYFTVSKTPAPQVKASGTSGGIVSSLRNGLGVVNKLMTNNNVRTGLDILNIVR